MDMLAGYAGERRRIDVAAQQALACSASPL
jgi:hypothetical protein